MGRLRADTNRIRIETTTRHRVRRAGSMRGGSHTEVAERTPQIAIGISENELTVAGLGWSLHLPVAAALGDVNHVPALLDRHNDVDACRNGSGVHRIDVLDAELEVNAATARELERSGAEPAPRSGSFLDHQLHAVALETREALRRPLEQNPELEHLSVETQRCGERGYIQLRYEHQLRTLLTRRAPRPGVWGRFFRQLDLAPRKEMDRASNVRSLRFEVMATDSSRTPEAPYGSARDLPSYRELSEQIRGAKLVTRVIARAQRQSILDVERELERLIRVVDAFYERLGSRNWIFNDSFNVDAIERLLVETADADDAETHLIELHRDSESFRFWLLRLRRHDGLLARMHQIERAAVHYDADEFDSCALHLVAVLDGFVNDFEPSVRSGLHARDPEEMTAWDSVVGHHLGLTHAMKTFTKTIKKRVDEPVTEVYRHGIMHGTVVSFDNIVVATKAWNMLFAVADWADATTKAAIPAAPKPTVKDVWNRLVERSEYQRYENNFAPRTETLDDPGFTENEVVVVASAFLDAWKHRRWALVAGFMPQILRRAVSEGEVARDAKNAYDSYDLADFTITQMMYDRASTAAIFGSASVNGEARRMEFRWVWYDANGDVDIPGSPDGGWRLAVWAPHTFFGDPQ
jgi:hypothetical protein